MGKHTSINILMVQAKEIEELIFQKAWLGYRNKSEFVRDAIRRHLDHCKMAMSSQKSFQEKDEY